MGFLSTFFTSRRTSLQHTLPPALFPSTECTVSVNSWACSIQDMVESQAYRICRIVHCKVKSGSRHEFLLVYIRHPSGKMVAVLIDRDTSFDPPSAYADEDSPPLCAQMEMRMLGTTPSRDRIRLSSDGSGTSLTRNISGGWAEIHTVRFPKTSEAPSVAHLAALLMTVHRHVVSPGMPMEVRNGWFAYCVAEVMRETFLGKSKTSKAWVRVPYGGMQVEGRDTVDALIREFQSAWENFSRRLTARGSERSSERASQHEEVKKAQMNSFVGMLQTMDL